MFGRRGLSSSAKPAFEEPRRRGFGPADTVFDPSLWEGETGDFLRSAGFAPDDPINRLDRQEPVAAQLAEDRAELQHVLDSLASQLPYPVGPFDLLPDTLWRGRMGGFLRTRLDLAPYRPWNTFMLPLDARGSAAMGLPIGVPCPDPSPLVEHETVIEMLAELFAGRSSPEAEAIAYMCDSVAGNFAFLFPPEIRDFSPGVCLARRRVRAYAFMHAVTKRYDKETVIGSQQVCLANPEIQLVA